MACKVAARQFGQRFVALERSGDRDHFIKQGKGELLASPGARADYTFQLSAMQYKSESQVFCRNAGLPERSSQFSTGELFATLERLSEDSVAFSKGCLV